MSDLAIKVENLGKMYRIGGPQERYKTFRDAVVNGTQAPFRRIAKFIKREAASKPGSSGTIWALKDVSFEIRRGEVVGIIGRNGAGKTTALKILSRITEPTEGYADIYGRVGSLLEVGTGFHPELTGRENIYLNGAILGMRRVEIGRKFDEIVDFAEVEKFIDTPVKHYSTGMYLRLAFAVAAHLEPEILLVDEVLAVGDAAFQKKCLGKMGEVAKEGRTVLFVSHNMAAVSKLCLTAILLENGMLTKCGNAAEIVLNYSRQFLEDERGIIRQEQPVHVRLLKVDNGSERVNASSGISLSCLVDVHKAFWRLQMLLIVRNMDQVLILLDGIDSKRYPKLLEPGVHEVNIQFPPLWLNAGQYSCYIKILADDLGGLVRYVSDPLLFNVVTEDEEEWRPRANELLVPKNRWVIESVTPQT